MGYNKEKWRMFHGNIATVVGADSGKIAIIYGNSDEEEQANAQLIAAAPIGDELANAVLEMEFDDYDDFLELQEIAREFKDKAEGKC